MFFLVVYKTFSYAGVPAAADVVSSTAVYQSDSAMIAEIIARERVRLAMVMRHGLIADISGSDVVAYRSVADAADSRPCMRFSDFRAVEISPDQARAELHLSDDADLDALAMADTLLPVYLSRIISC